MPSPNSIVVDMHCHPVLKTFLFKTKFEEDNLSPFWWNPFWTMRVDLPKMKTGGIDVILSSIYFPEKRFINECKLLKWLLSGLGLISDRIWRLKKTKPFEGTMEMLEHFEDLIGQLQSNGEKIRVAHSYGELQEAIDQREKAIIHCVEGAHSLGLNLDTKKEYLDNLEAFFKKGVCLLTIAHFNDNDIVSPVIGMPPSFRRRLLCHNGRDPKRGLTPLGEMIVEKMIELGMIIDLTHSTCPARNRVFDINNKHSPLVFSHVGLCQNPYNPDKIEIKKIADCGGIIGILFLGYFLRCKELKFLKRDAVLDIVVETIKCIAHYGGVNTVGIGTDLDSFSDPPDDLKDISEIPKLRDRLKQGGFNESDVELILGGNVLRVLKDGWKKN